MKNRTKFTAKQITRMRKAFEELGASRAAALLTHEFKMEVSRSDIRYWAGTLRKELLPSDMKKEKQHILSQDHKKIQVATKTECVKEIRRLAEANPEISITRNWFRKNSRFAESAWNEHFGTFEEFRRCSGVILSRHARQMETAIARHASMDTYREMNLEKRNWADKYLKPTDVRFQTYMVGSDIHDIECDPFWRMLFIDTLARVQPSKLILNGDIFDLPEFGKYNVDPREWDVVGRIKWVHEFLRDVRKVAPNTEITMIEGNHEYRMLRHLSEATPAMKAILGDLHGWTVRDLLGLKEFEVNYIAPADLAAYNKGEIHKEVARNFLIIDNFLCAHHFPEGRSFGLPGWNGHHHSHVVSTQYSPIHGSFEWHQLGSGHKREATYCNGEKWSNGFLLVHADTVAKRAQFEYIDTTSNHCVIGGKWYQRGD